MPVLLNLKKTPQIRSYSAFTLPLSFLDYSDQPFQRVAVRKIPGSVLGFEMVALTGFRKVS